MQQDANFNVTALVNGSGSVVERYAYDPFGAASIYDASWGSRSGSNYGWMYLHQGGRFDATSGLYYFRNRDYSATLGRWGRLDPIDFGGGDWNLYRAMSNEPIDCLDPFGKEPKKRDGMWGPEDWAFTSIMTGKLELDADPSQLSQTAGLVAQAGLGNAGAKERIGPGFFLKDKDAGKDCCGNQGERVWVSFMIVHSVAIDGVSNNQIDQAFANATQRPLHAWFWDWYLGAPIKDIPTTKVSNFFDLPGLNAGTKYSVNLKETELIGIACRSKKNHLLFKKDLLDKGTVAIEIDWDAVGKHSTVEVWPHHQWPGDDVWGHLLNDGKWIKIMGGGASEWK